MTDTQSADIRNVSGTEIWQLIETPDMVARLIDEQIERELLPLVPEIRKQIQTIRPSDDGTTPKSWEMDWSIVTGALGESVKWTPRHLDILNEKLSTRGWIVEKKFSHLRGANKDSDYLIFTKKGGHPNI